VNRLRVARDASIVLVNAPAGYGKTTLAADWARRDGRPFAWYTVGEGDDAGSFVAHLAAAVERALPERESAPATAASRPDESVARLGRALAASESPLVVVVDDVELLADAEAIRVLERFSEELPSGSQLALLTRAETALPVARLRARGRLVEFGLEDLRFSDREAAALLQQVGVELDRAGVEALNAAVEGWPAGLFLGALSLRSGAGERDGAAPHESMIAGYLRAELLASLPGDELRFLTRVSVLDRLCGPLCDVVAESEDSSARLERLERSNLFVVPLDRERRWYRVHPVFRQLLADELERREPGAADPLRSRAAAWCAQWDEPESALDYARAAGDLNQLIELVEGSALPFTATAEPGRVERWLGLLDDDALLERHPSAAAIGALTWAMIGRPDAAQRWADAADRSARRARGEPAAVSPLRSLLHSLMCPRGAKQMRADAKTAVDTLPPGSAWRAPALLVLGSANAVAGDSPQAESILREAADAAASSGAAAVQAIALGYQSLLANERGDWRHADALAEAARRTVRDARLDDDVTSLFAFAASARSALRRGAWTTVRADLERAGLLLPRLTYAIGSFAVLLRLEFARVQLALGDAEAALGLLDEVDEIFAQRPRLGVFRKDAVELRARVEEDAVRAQGRMATLTAAELRLLPLLTTQLSFREIADRLYVSRNTVKTQAISVYRKLGVTSRGDAISRASHLGLVADD
jgi:LuxR family maltose regulon positive regulatory protein